MIYEYPCELHVDEDGAFVPLFPDVPEAITGAWNRREALTMAADALATALAGYVQEGWEIPAPSPFAEGHERVAVPPVVAAELARYTAQRTESITKVD